MTTDHVKRVCLMTERGERVVVGFRSANATHPILSVSGMSKKGIQSVTHRVHNAPSAQRTECTTHRVHNAPSAQRTECTTHRVHNAPSAQRTECTTHRVPNAPSAQRTECPTHRVHNAPSAQRTECTTHRVEYGFCYPVNRSFTLCHPLTPQA